MPKSLQALDYRLVQLASVFEQLPEPRRSLLTRHAIASHIGRENIVIYPFDFRNLKTTSYDMRLGEFFFREKQPDGEESVFNPFDPDDVRHYWGKPQRAERAGDWMKRHRKVLKNIRPDDRIILVAPGETILTHTMEFAGGRKCVTTEMRARSSMGRVGITVCKCAGWGDLGYINRWTMEMTNHMRRSYLVLVAGQRVAQLIFYQVDQVPNASYAAEKGKYQTTDVLEKLVRNWKPEDMLPRMDRDYEITEGFPLMEERRCAKNNRNSKGKRASSARAQAPISSLGAQRGKSAERAADKTGGRKNLRLVAGV